MVEELSPSAVLLADRTVGYKPAARRKRIEDRSGGTNRKYSIYFAFNNALASVASATTSCGTVTGVAVEEEDTNQVVVDIAGVTCNESDITVTVNGVVDEQGTICPLSRLPSAC